MVEEVNLEEEKDAKEDGKGDAKGGGKGDTNEDGKISYEEFEFWWLNSHKGQLGELIALRKKMVKYTKIRKPCKSKRIKHSNL